MERKETCLTPFHSLVEWWGFTFRALRDWGFPRRVQSKLSWVPLQGIAAGGRELLLPISMCCVSPSLHVAGKRVPAWCLQHCIHEGTGLTASYRPVTTGNKAQSPAERLKLLCSRDWVLTLHSGSKKSLESTMSMLYMIKTRGSVQEVEVLLHRLFGSEKLYQGFGPKVLKQLEGREVNGTRGVGSRM